MPGQFLSSRSGFWTMRQCYRAALVWRAGQGAGGRPAAVWCLSSRAVSTVKRSGGQWESESNRRKFFDDLGASFGVVEPGDWKNVSRKDVVAHGGRGLLDRYSSLAAALADAYPELSMEPHQCRTRRPAKYWESMENRRAFMLDVERRLGIETADDWAKVTNKDFAELGGGRLLNIYSGSLLQVLRGVFPEREVAASCRGKTPKNFYDTPEGKRKFMEMVAMECGIEEEKDWRTVTFDRLAQLGGRQLLAENSVTELLKYRPTGRTEGCDGVDEEDGKDGLFVIRPSVPSSFWQEETNVIEFMRHAGKELGVNEPEDWHRVSLPQLLEVKGARGMLRQIPLIHALRIAYPKVNWKKSNLTSKLKKASQRHMVLNVKGLFGLPLHQSTLTSP